MKKEKPLSDRQKWELKFIEKLACVHKRKIDVKAKKLLKRIDGVKNGMVTTFQEIQCPLLTTVEDLRELAYQTYGTPCKYSQRILSIENMVFDHIIPISKGGDSSRENIQVISKFSNNMKGSLDEASFLMLLSWLETVPEHLRKDISIRLAHGIH